MKSFRADESKLELAHKHSMRHRLEIINSELCGCFYCGEKFPPNDIKDWVDEQEGLGGTAICPRCGIDSVIGSQSGFPLSQQFLQQMHARWFRTVISTVEFDRLSAGQFVSLRLAGGPTVEGYAARDPDDPRLIRLDGLALEDDGSVGQFSLRLEQPQIEAVAILANAPQLADSQGRVHLMGKTF